ncbi:MAG TPA: hypothetical protein VIK48_00030, partial [Candidatus Manganitrophaceae bacterium]
AIKPRLLMCPPDFYDTHFLFNPWLSYSEEVDRVKARKQWTVLKETIEEAGGDVTLIEPRWGESAMVFTRDNALVFDREKVLILRSHGPRGKREPKALASWFKKNGFKVFHLPAGMGLEGGNILFLNGETLLAGWKPGEDLLAYKWLKDFLSEQTGRGVNLIMIRLTNHKYLHLDMALSVLKEKGFLINSIGLSIAEGWENADLWRGRPVFRFEKESFGANMVIVNNTIITGALEETSDVWLKGLGFDVRQIDLSEFYKAGGGAHCLTLELAPSF